MLFKVLINICYDNVTPRELQKEKYKGWFIPAENLIQLLKNGDESTIVHEFAHWWLDRLVKYSQYNEELALDLEEVRKFLKNDGGEFTRDQHEKFAAVSTVRLMYIPYDAFVIAFNI